MTFKLNPKQKQAVKILSQFANILLYGGGRSGKTYIIVRAIVIRALKVKSRHLIVRKHFNHVKMAIWNDTLPKVINTGFPGLMATLDPNKSDFVYRFPHNGSEIFIGGLDEKERTEKVLGNEYSSLFFSESSQITYDAVTIGLTRLAEKNSLIKRAYFDMNPVGKKHWTYKLFKEKRDPETGLLLNDPEEYCSLQMNPVDNKENIDSAYLKRLENLPASKKKRFYDGEFSDDTVGAVFNTNLIKRLDYLPNDVDRIVIGWDPAVTSKITSDEHGIIICARKGDLGYVVADYSGIFTPLEAAKIICEVYKTHKCDKVIGEVNQGGDYIETVLKSVNPFISYKSVRATRGKVKRAEPVAALYEQGRIYHIGFHPDLENEMDDFKVDESEMDYSPNRNDAMNWAMAELFNLYDVEPTIRVID